MQTLIKKKPVVLNANSTICCGGFENNVKKFSWLAYTNDGVNKYIIPHIVVTDKFGNKIKKRVNYCPICGFNVRNVELSQEIFDRYFNNDDDNESDVCSHELSPVNSAGYRFCKKCELSYRCI